MLDEVWMLKQGIFLQEGVGQATQVLFQASRGRFVNGSGAILPVTSPLI